MKQTNYHLFDFLDFDTELKTDESLWKACKPTSIYEKGGYIFDCSFSETNAFKRYGCGRECFTERIYAENPLLFAPYPSFIYWVGRGRLGGGDRNVENGFRRS